MIVMHDPHQTPQGAASLSLSAGTYKSKQPADPANILVSAPFDVRGRESRDSRQANLLRATSTSSQ